MTLLALSGLETRVWNTVFFLEMKSTTVALKGNLESQLAQKNI